jgi:putative transposase
MIASARGVEPICKVLPIAPSTYWAHAATRRDPAKGSAKVRSYVAATTSSLYWRCP